MRTEAISAGFYHSEVWQRDYPKIQIRTIDDLLNGNTFDIPPPPVHVPGRPASPPPRRQTVRPRRSRLVPFPFEYDSRTEWRVSPLPSWERARACPVLDTGVRVMPPPGERYREGARPVGEMQQNAAPCNKNQTPI